MRLTLAAIAAVAVLGVTTSTASAQYVVPHRGHYHVVPTYSAPVYGGYGYGFPAYSSGLSFGSSYYSPGGLSFGVGYNSGFGGWNNGGYGGWNGGWGGYGGHSHGGYGGGWGGGYGHHHHHHHHHHH